MKSTTTRTVVAGCVAVCVAQIGLVLPAPINGVIQQVLHTTGSQLSWVTDAFLVPAAILELTFGVLGDLFGRKRLLVGGGALMALGYLVSATATSVQQLWAGQAVSGIGAAALFPASLAVVAAATPAPAARARGLASWTTALSTGALVAPLLSGTIAEHASFRWAFGATGVLALLSAVISLMLTGDSRAPEGRALDWPGQLTIAGSLLALLYGVIQGPTSGWRSVGVVTAFVLAVVLLAAFVAVESRAAAPMLRLSLFRIPAFAAAAAVAVVGMFGFLGGAYDLSIRVGAVQHQSTLRSALPFVVIQGITPFVWPLLTRLLERVGPRPMLTAGLLLIAVGQFWLATLPISDTGLPPALGALILMGIGFGLLVSAVTAAAVNAVPLRLAGMASATTSLVRDLGQTLGPAVVGAVALSQAAATFAARIGHAGLAPAQLHVVQTVNAAGGQFAVLGADLGPASAKAAPVALGALAHGFAVGLVVTGTACVAAAAIAAVFLRGAHGGDLAAETDVTAVARTTVG